MDPDFQNAVMDIQVVADSESAERALEIYEDADTKIAIIDESIKRDKAKRQYKDYSQVIDALLNSDPADHQAAYEAIKKNNDAYWCGQFRMRIERSAQGRLYGHFQALLSRLIHPDWTGLSVKEQREMQVPIGQVDDANRQPQEGQGR